MIADGLLSDVLARLELESISPDLPGLRSFYRAWCLHVPFDNLRKTSALFKDPEGPMPDLSATSFFEEWLRHGTGGTCWPHGEALYGALHSLGFNTTRATASMFDFPGPNHATTLVHFADLSTWLVDNALLTLEPLRIDSGAPSHLSHPLHYAEVELEGDTVFVHGTNPPMPGIFFRLNEHDVPYERYDELWAACRNIGPFNGGAHIRRNFLDRILTLRGSRLYTLTVEGLETVDLDAEAIQYHLSEVMGVHPGFVKEWSSSGALEASLTPPGPAPEFPVRIPPSKRA